MSNNINTEFSEDHFDAKFISCPLLEIFMENEERLINNIMLSIKDEDIQREFSCVQSINNDTSEIIIGEESGLNKRLENLAIYSEPQHRHHVFSNDRNERFYEECEHVTNYSDSQSSEIYQEPIIHSAEEFGYLSYIENLSEFYQENNFNSSRNKEDIGLKEKPKRQRMKKDEKNNYTPEKLEQRRKEKNRRNTNKYNNRKLENRNNIDKQIKLLQLKYETLKKNCTIKEKQFYSLNSRDESTISNNEDSVVKDYEKEKKSVLSSEIYSKTVRGLKEELNNKKRIYENAISDEKMKKENRNTYGSRKTRAKNAKELAELQYIEFYFRNLNPSEIYKILD